MKANDGYFPFPNEVIDALLSKLTGAEFKVLSVVIRQTLGWKKHWDRIAVSQFRTKGGMSKAGVVVSLDVLIANKLILCEKVKEDGKLPENWYALFGETNEKDRLVRSPDQYDKQTGTLIILELVRSVDQLGDKLVRSPAPQKKGFKNKVKTIPPTPLNKVTTGIESQKVSEGGGGDSLNQKIDKLRKAIFDKYKPQITGPPTYGACNSALHEFDCNPLWLMAAVKEAPPGLKSQTPASALNLVRSVAMDLRDKSKGVGTSSRTEIEELTLKREYLEMLEADREEHGDKPDYQELVAKTECEIEEMEERING